MPIKKTTLSIVIPLYNEEKRLIKTVPKIQKKAFELSKKINVELIFVNDGSTDKTHHHLKKIITHKNTKTLKYKNNKGKGYALKQGFKKATGDYILFMDVDLSTPLKHIDHFLNHLSKDTIVIGSRKTKGSNVVKHQNFIRENLGKGFTLLSNIFLVQGISDFTCGFKLFPKRAGKKIFSNLTINRWGFDSEVLFLAKKYGYPIKQLPVEWSNDKNTKVNLLKDIFGSLKELVIIRLNNAKGLYK